MNYLREKVSGNKNRKKEGNYNLDLTYICPRIIAMSFPGEGIEIAYRNDINDVSQFVKEKHQNDFQIYNLSGRGYDYSKFNKKVFDFVFDSFAILHQPWEDHHSPPLNLLFLLCKHIDDFLSSKLANVVILHCLAGKGRTGTAICCYLLYSGRFTDPQEALQFYAKQRFAKEGGVTQPSQVRYVHYFASILHNPIQYPVLKFISQVCLNTVPKIGDKGSCRPYMEIYTFENNEMKLRYTDKAAKYKEQRKYKDMKIKELNQIKLNVQVPFAAIGDLLIKVFHNGKFKTEPLFRIAINTTFIEDNKMEFQKQLLDPHKIMKHQTISEDIQVEINFKDFCKCTTKMPFKERCKSCTTLSKQQSQEWGLIQNILNDYVRHSLEESRILLFGNPEYEELNQLKHPFYQVPKEESSDEDEN